MRCVHESKMHRSNSFVTLTFDEKNVPESISLRDLQLFIKRLRKSVPYKIRFFGCGEYGDQFDRPHYHALIFNHWFDDAKKFSANGKSTTYTSKKLEKLWPFGFSTLGAVTYQSAAYVARYCIKKVGGELVADHYQGRSPEFITMSGKPGIGLAWLEKFMDDCYPSDFLIVDGKKHPIPKYYDQKLKALDEKALAKIKGRRSRAAYKHRADQTPARLAVREEVAKSKLARLPRVLGDYSNDSARLLDSRRQDGDILAPLLRGQRRRGG